MSDSQPASANRAVFLSYASQDAEAARRICETLRASGVEVWFDADGGLEHGDEWDAKIRRQIKDCVLFIPVISASTQARHEGYFRIEWELAAQRALGIASGVPFILPVVIDDTREPDALVPDRFRAVQWTKLRAGEVPPEVQQRFLKLWSHRTGVLKHESQEVARAFQPVRSEDTGSKARATPKVGRRVPAAAWIAGATVALALLGVGFGWQAWRRADANEHREGARAEIERLIKAQEIGAAFALTTKARSESPDDPALREIWERVSTPADIDTTPTGADIYVKQYTTPNAEWQLIGRTPLPAARLPAAHLRWKIVREGSETLERAAGVTTKVRFALPTKGTVPAGMVPIPGGRPIGNSTGLTSLNLPDYFLDRYEVSNREFKVFVDGGGYTNPAYWKQPFVRAGRTLTREEAVAEFRDVTGQAGPAGWRNGSYRADEDDLPVTGVSWFEAAAYAEFAGKRLPTIYHWRAASVLALTESMVPLSNFSGRGLTRRGTQTGMSNYGVYDLAGNAKEWCWNAADNETRYLLGGAWREPDYMFTQLDALSPFDRSETNGFRCMKLATETPVPPSAYEALPPPLQNFATAKPVNDEAFAIIRGLYDYDAVPLESRVESTDDSDQRWRKEKVSYRAAYGQERISAYLFLPKNSAPPYQVIVFFPGSGATTTKSSENLRDMNTVAALVGSGRTVVYPIYQGTYERRTEQQQQGLRDLGPAGLRDLFIAEAKDFRRTIDYLESRPDIQSDKLAYMGLSWGAAMGAILPAVEKRVKVSVLMIGGLYLERGPPEIAQVNFAPRNTAPTLMLNGRADFTFPVETSQRPLFRLLGAPPEHKRQVLFDTGHALKPEQIASEAYAWLDRYLGQVK